MEVIMLKKKKKKSFSSRLLAGLKIIFVFILIVVLVGGAFTLFTIKNALSNIKPIDPSKINTLLVENSVILDSNGNELENLNNDGLRTLVKYSDISETLIDAYVSTEDKTFFEHSGFNIIRMFGAVKDSLISDKRIQGTSTITQQLARNLYLFEIRSKRTIDRKIKEAYYAIQLEKYLTKEQIIEAYLNTIYLGSNSKGVEAASQKYFSKSAIELNLVESAILAGIPKSPTKYTPMYLIKNENLTENDRILSKVNELYTIIYNDQCEDRFKLVLYLMKTNNYISESEYSSAIDTDIFSVLSPNISKGNEISSYFSDMVESEVVNDLMEKYDYSKSDAINFLYTSGLNIYSTIDFDMQKTLESAYANDTFTDYFGQPTKEAVINFQIANDLQVDGSVGKQTISKLEELNAIKQSEIISSSLKKGYKNEDVIILKKALNKLNLLSNNDLFPRIIVNFDKDNNIITEDTKNIILYKYSNLINDNNQFFLNNNDFKFDSDGNLILFRSGKLSFYSHYDKDGNLNNIQIVIKNLFKYNETDKKTTKNRDGSYNISELYSYQGRDLLVPDKYKSYDDKNNIVISKDFINSKDNFFKLSNNSLYIDSDHYVVSDKGTIQPQSAMLIIDYHTGYLKAIVGGRNITGQKIYNRALNPRQPGSSVKPFSVYTPAIESGEYTAASVIDDVPSYLTKNPNVRWPVNWYEHYSSYEFKYRGISTLRQGIEQSMNVVTAKLANAIGIETCINSMKNFGVSTIVDKGSINDHNLSAVALGGMTNGISPMELAEAYGTFGNNGIKIDTITYTKVVNHDGEILLNNIPDKEKIISENVSFIIRDIMRTGVTNGISYKAKIRDNNVGIPVAGKTGTTSNNYDAWFTGMTPYYVGVTWFGTDYNMPLDQGSTVSAEFWNYVMKNIHEDLPDKDFSKPADIVTMKVDTKSGKIPTQLSYLDPRNTVINEYFIPGTQPTELDDIHVQVEICKESGLLATEYCPTTLIENKVLTKRLDGPYYPKEHLNDRGAPLYIGDQKYSVPNVVCNFHGEIIEIFDYESLSPDKHLIFLPNKIGIVTNPFEITLTSGISLLLPVRTRIMFNRSIILPDNSVIEASEIADIPHYQEALYDFLNESDKIKKEKN
jgi:penicillin-binding protein 1A